MGRGKERPIFYPFNPCGPVYGEGRRCPAEAGTPVIKMRPFLLERFGGGLQTFVAGGWLGIGVVDLDLDGGHLSGR